MATDLRQLSAEQLLTLINNENDTALTFNEIEFDVPTTLVDDIDGRNTHLTVKSRPNSGYVGDVAVKYNRLNMSEFAQYGEPVIEIPDGGTLSDVIDAFNDFYDANLVLDDDIDSTLELPEVDYVGKTFTLPATASSLAYQGAIDLTLKFTSRLLSEAIAQINLNGLEWPGLGPTLLNGTVELKYNAAYGSSISTKSTLSPDGILYTFTKDATDRSYSFNFIRLDLKDPTLAPVVSQETLALNGNGLNDLHSHSLTYYNNKLYIYGGNWDGVIARQTMMSYDLTNKTMTELASTPSGPSDNVGHNGTSSNQGHTNHTATLYNGKIYIIGGNRSNSYMFKKVYIYDIDSNTWGNGANIPIPSTEHGRTEHTSVLIDGKIYLLGGKVLTNKSLVRSNRLYCYDIATNAWSEKEPIPTAGRAQHYAAACDGIMYVYGGRRDNVSSGFSNDLWAYDPAEDTWTEIPVDATTAKTNGTMVEYDGKLWTYGRLSGGTNYPHLHTIT